MNSLSTSALCPVAFHLGLLLVMATAFPTPALRGEDPKDDATPNRPALTSPHKPEELIMFILSKISELRKEICEKYGKCGKTPEALAENNLNLPTMTEKDGCFHVGFNQETCMTRIITGLLKFQLFLEYLNNFEGHKGKFEEVQMGTNALIQILKQKIKNPDKVTLDPTANAIQLTEQPQSDWLKNTTIHLILQDLRKFLENSLRALRNYAAED
ncbi:interleukin-6 [Dasypus novemcinctus]|uniref:interleukin-6 n=1 Tax=Dasypus novemcinctus TaxID=9361 RepID=UPI00265E536F|nr:interleukin-6 [Dasypus novemcinctus]